jgi:hypothetical protein
MSTVSAAWKKVVENLGKTGEQVAGAFEKFGTFFTSSASSSGSGLKSFSTFFANVVKQPVKWLAYAANIPIKTVGFVYSRAPILSAGATILGGGLIVGKWLRNRAEHETQNDLMAQAMGQVPVGYGSAITADEYALLESRMKQSGAAQTCFADAITAKRAAAADRPAPQTAAV